MDVKKVGVIGAGTMGHGIAQVFAASGYQVVLRDISDDFVNKPESKQAEELIACLKSGRNR